MKSLPGEPPQFTGLNPMMLDNRELGEAHEALGDWVGRAEQAEDGMRPPQWLIDEVRAALRSVAKERAHRRTL